MHTRVPEFLATGQMELPPCPFLTSGPSRHILYRRYRLSMRALPDFQFCRCPEILMLGDKANVSVSIFCLNRHLKFTSKIPLSAQDWIGSRYVLLPESRTLNL